MSKKENDRLKEEHARRKAARRAERVSDRSKLILESRLVEEGKIYPRDRYMPHGTFRGILAVALALFFGIFLGLGALVGAGVFAASRVKLNKIPGITDWIDESKTDQSLLSFITQLAGDAQNFKTLGGIREYTPAVDKLVDLLEKNLSPFGIEFDDTLEGKLLDTPFEGLGDFFMNDVVKTLELGKVAKVNGNTDAILLALCYGEEGVDYDIDKETNAIVLRDGGRAPTTVGTLLPDEDGKDGISDLLNTMRLGTLMKLNKGVDDQKLSENALMYALCYGKQGVDYTIDEEGRIIPTSDQNTGEQEKNAPADSKDTYVHTFPTTLDALMNHSNAVLNCLELGTMLGLDRESDGKKISEKIEENGVMYSLAYGARDIDWELKTEGDKEWIEMLPGHDAQYPAKMEAFTEQSSTLVQNLEVETLMSVKPGSDKLMHYLAYGPEMEKGKEPYTSENGVWTDANGSRVDENGYLLNADGGFLTEPILNDAGEETGKYQYAGGGTYFYHYDAEKNITGIEMLHDPNDPEKLFKKKKVGDLTEKDAKLLDGMKLGDVMEIESDASGLMKAIKDWTIEDLKDQEKIESLEISDVIDIDENSAGIMKAFKARKTTIGDLKDQETIDSLKLSDIIAIHEEDDPEEDIHKSSDILLAMRDWQVSDLQNQNRIERLKIGSVIEVGADASGLMTAIKDWRIGDLTKQEKIDSLTLGDVLTIDDNAPALLKTLKKSQLGELSERVNTLRLSEILDEGDLDGNKILKHLKDSTLDALADDIQKLSVGDVFGDEMYSYMEIETKEVTYYTYADNNGGWKGTETTETVTVDYEWLYNTYFHKVGSEKRTDKDKTILPQDIDHIDVTMYNYNFKEYNGVDANGAAVKDAFVFRPTAVTLEKGALQTRKIVKDNAGTKTEVAAGYYRNDKIQEEDEDKYTLIDKPVIRDAKTGNYYYENQVDLTPHYVYGVYDYKNGTVGTLKEAREEGGKLLFTYTDNEEYEVKSDNFSDYIVVADKDEPDGKRVDLEKVIDYYTTQSGAKVEFAKKTVQNSEGESTTVEDRSKVVYNEETFFLRHDSERGIDYITEKINVELRYADAKGTLYTEDEIEEYYYYMKNGKEQQLGRYISGVWFLLLGEKLPEKDENGTPIEYKNPIDAINFKTDTPILSMDSSITNVSSSMQNTSLAELWFHGLLDDTPFADLSTSFPEGLAFKHTNAAGETSYRIVKNLIEVSLSETLGLVKAFNEKMATLVAKLPNA